VDSDFSGLPSPGRVLPVIPFPSMSGDS
jgi:hypothetical protein